MDKNEAEEEVEDAGFAVVPPSGFVRVVNQKSAANRACWRRVHPNSDEVELLTVSRTGSRLDQPTGRRLAKVAEKITKASVPANAKRVQVSARALAGKPGEAHAETYRAHEDGARRQHSLFRWFTNDRGDIVMVAIGASDRVSMEQLEQDAGAVVESFRELKKKTEPNVKKWWQFFK